MRPIKFRAWDKQLKNMFFWDLIDSFNVEITPISHNPFVNLKNKYDTSLNIEFMQYTGLLDKNGLTNIYEDDIIDNEGRIIGNKYQNNELLKESANYLIQGFGTEDWEATNKEALARGCKYA